MKLRINQSRRGVLLVLLSACCWATMPIFSTWAYRNGSDPLTAAAWRSYLAAIFCFIWFLLDGSIRRLNRRNVLFFVGMGVVAVGGTFILYMKAVEMLSTPMAAILNYTAPAFVILLDRIFYRRPVSKVKRFSLVTTFAGAALVVRAYDVGSLSGKWLGILVGLASGLCYSLTTVLGSRRPDIDGKTRAGFMLMFSPLTFLAVKPPWTLAMPSGPLWLAYLGLAVIGSVLAYLCYMNGLATGLDGGIASITATMEPVISTLLSVLIFHDELEWLQILGIVIVLVGVVMPQLETVPKTIPLAEQKGASR